VSVCSRNSVCPRIPLLSPHLLLGLSKHTRSCHTIACLSGGYVSSLTVPSMNHTTPLKAMSCVGMAGMRVLQWVSDRFGWGKPTPSTPKPHANNNPFAGGIAGNTNTSPTYSSNTTTPGVRLFVFRRTFTLKDATSGQACSLEARACVVTNGIQLGYSLPLTGSHCKLRPGIEGGGGNHPSRTPALTLSHPAAWTEGGGNRVHHLQRASDGGSRRV
jgi:hypothetical protein